MGATRSLLELPISPVEVGSAEKRTFTVDLTAYLAGGTINSQQVKVLGGAQESDVAWTDLTSTVLSGAVTLAGNILTFTLTSFTVGFGYRATITWNSAASSFQTFERFLILRCLY